MSRIKFLDVLEETKNKPTHNMEKEYSHASHDNYIPQERMSYDDMPRRSRISSMESNRENFTREHTSSIRDRGLDREFSRDKSLAYENGYMGRQSVSERTNHIKPDNFGVSQDDYKVMWTGALFVLFGGLLFLSGYWVGKSIKGNVKTDREILMAKPINQFQSKQDTELSRTVQPIASTVDTIPIPASTPKPVKVIEPAIAETPAPPVKKVAPKPAKTSTKEYIIQVSAHSTIESARVVEDQLRKEGFSAYTSESAIGDSIFFRVRVRGFQSKDSAQKTLTTIKSKNLGLDGFVLTLD